MKVTCIMCPVGCELDVEKQGEKITVTGNGCPRGVIYGEREVTKPERIVTTVKIYKDRTLSLKTDKPIDKQFVSQVLKAVKRVEVAPNPKAGDILIENIFNTGVNVVITSVN